MEMFMRLCKQTKEWFCRRTIPNPGDTVWRHGIHNPFRSLALKICCGTGWWLATVTCSVGCRCKSVQVWLLVLCCYHLLSSPTLHRIDNDGHVHLSLVKSNGNPRDGKEMKGTSFPHHFWCKMVQVVWFSWQYGFSSTLSFRDIPGAAHQLRPWHRNGQCPPEGWAAMQVAWNHKWIIHWILYIEFLIPPDSSIKLGLKIVWGRLIMIIMNHNETIRDMFHFPIYILRHRMQPLVTRSFEHLLIAWI